MKHFEELEQVLADAKKDAEAFYEKNNKAAGTRLRKAMMSIKNLAQDVRNHVTELKNKG